MKSNLNTCLELRNAAEINILQYCKVNNCENEFNLFKNELIKQADEYNLKAPIDFYIEYYNLSIKLLKGN